LRIISVIQLQHHIVSKLGALVKTRGNRESGANPEQSRHCHWGVLYHVCHSTTPLRKKIEHDDSNLYLGCNTKTAFAERRGV